VATEIGHASRLTEDAAGEVSLEVNGTRSEKLRGAEKKFTA
jgi:hypothetical protein